MCIQFPKTVVIVIYVNVMFTNQCDVFISRYEFCQHNANASQQLFRLLFNFSRRCSWWSSQQKQ
jgi:hypothetical protein